MAWHESYYEGSGVWYWSNDGDGDTPNPPNPPSSPTITAIPPEPEGSFQNPYISPEATKSPEREKAKKTYLDWVKWKRQELGNLINKYKTEYPKQIAAYEQSALGALPKATKDMWGGMYTNLNKRGLSDSTSFIGGAKSDLAGWESRQREAINDTKQGMEVTAQQAILQALGQPDYPGLYQNWVNADDAQAAYKYNEFMRNKT